MSSSFLGPGQLSGGQGNRSDSDFLAPKYAPHSSRFGIPSKKNVWLNLTLSCSKLVKYFGESSWLMPIKKYKKILFKLVVLPWLFLAVKKQL